MPANQAIYEIPEKPFDDAFLGPFLRVDEALSRLDERALLSPLQAPWAQRILYRNACAAMHAQQGLVHLEDLVLLDGHAFAGSMYADLSAGLSILKLWQRALQGDATGLLRAPMPGEAERQLSSEITSAATNERARPELFWDPEWDEAGRLLQWRRIWQATDHLPPLLAAAIAWDAWHSLCPEQQGPWRSTLLAALVLRARGKTRHLLLPIDSGQRATRTQWNARDSYARRIETFLDIAAAAVKIASNELISLSVARERMALKLQAVRKHSRLADLIDLMIARPLVSIPLASRELGISKQAIRKLIPQLGSTPREITERTRYRCWSVL